MSGIRLHPRFLQVKEAELAFGKFLIELQEKYDLTEWEVMGMLLSEAMTIKKYALRSERHPDNPDKGGDAA